MQLTAEQRAELEERITELQEARAAFVEQANREIAASLAREDELSRLLAEETNRDRPD